jgi:hypothetical protein
MKKKELMAYMKVRKGEYEYLSTLKKSIQEHPMYQICEESVDRGLEIDNYESGNILGISKIREGFDALYEFSHCYRGGLMEIKVGEHYVIYGFEFD